VRIVALQLTARRFEVALRLALPFEPLLGIALLERLRCLTRGALRVLDLPHRMLRHRPLVVRLLGEIARPVGEPLLVVPALLELGARALGGTASHLRELLLRPLLFGIELATRLLHGLLLLAGRILDPPVFLEHLLGLV